MDNSLQQCEPFRIAIVQMNPQRSCLTQNRETIIQKLEEAVAGGAKLVLFPECALSGYVFESANEAFPATETVPGATSELVIETCQRLNVYAIVGLLERDGEKIYNSAFVTGPEGLIANYRKCHLPILGIDRFAAKGDSLPVIDLPFARIGLLICYDLRFPEAARKLCLNGADVLAVPTNWPEGAESSPDYLTRARAWENRFYVAACNRVGVEGGTRFIGRSQVVSPDGTLLALADGETETILYAEVDPAVSRQKKMVIKAGEFEFDPVGHRRLDLYPDLA